MHPLRILIIEDHDDFREGLAHLIRLSDGFAVAGSFSSVEEALVEPPPCDIVLCDIQLPGQPGSEAIEEIKRRLPGSAVIMLTVFDDDEHVFRSILNGADGYLLKKTSPALVLTALRDAADGGTPMTPYVARRVIELFRRYAPAEKGEYALTPRELEVLQSLVDGLDPAAISRRYFISRETVRNHIRHIYEKLHVHSRSQAVAKALREGLL
jgi:DNA-binding NarL/FixJ family response regulator